VPVLSVFQVDVNGALTAPLNPLVASPNPNPSLTASPTL